MPDPRDRLNDLLSAYLAAEYRWQRDGQWLPLVIGKPAPDVEDAFPDATRFGAVSAWNPQSVPQREQVNRDADHALHDVLECSGLPYRPAFATGRNRSWKESSWLVAGMPMSEFDDLAQRFGQLSTLWWERGEPVRLRMYAERPAGDEHAFVDWIK